MGLLSILLIYTLVVSYYCNAIHNHGKRMKMSHKEVPPNILEILVDDLGYGDTSVAPFIGLGVKTPNLERMASKGTVLTNYHTAAATCTPTRASILTGMYPWRLGIKAVFEYGQRHHNRNDWLVQVPTIPMVLREANYSVTHSGKWHLGGMRNDDLNLRHIPIQKSEEQRERRCPHPGPNQQGFKNYISMLDGPGSPRQNRLQLNEVLYSQGCTALLQNDIDIGSGAYNITGYLSYCEAEHAIRAINHSVIRNKPFFIQLWFHAPHAPLEGIPGYPEYLKKDIKINTYNKADGKIRYKTTNVSNIHDMGPVYKYRSMIADMDHQIGRIMQRIEELGIENNTLVVFTSDNGPENSAGTTAGFRGKKRYLYEGGIRVPALVQWTGTVPAGQVSDAFVVSTDLFPTFLDAAGVMVPQQVRLDGLSFLPLIVPNYYKLWPKPPTTTDPTPVLGRKTKLPVPSSTSTTAVVVNNKHIVDRIREDPELYRMAIRDRVTLWHNDYEGERRTAAWVYDFKIILNEQELMSEMYDMHTDKYEKQNLIANIESEYWEILNKTIYSVTTSTTTTTTTVYKKHPILRKYIKNDVTLDMILKQRDHKDVPVWIASHLYKLLQEYAKYGNTAHQYLLTKNKYWSYKPTLYSDYRSDFINTAALRTQANLEAKQNILYSNYYKYNINTTASTSSSTSNSHNSCDIRTVRSVQSLPFEEAPTGTAYAYLHPGNLFLSTSQLLGV